MLLCMLWSMGTANAAEQWVKTAPTDLTTGDVVVIVDQTSVTAMPNNNGTSSAPTATTVTLSTDKTEITSEVGTTLQWTVTVGTANDGARTYQFATGTDYLYATNTNNGVRVGTNTNNVFTISVNENVDFLYNTGQKRYIGVYNSQDWRCYTSINANIKDCVTTFYKKVDTSSSSAVSTTTTIDASGITNTNIYTGTNAGQLAATVKAGDTTIDDAIVAWSSSNEAVATVASDGTVTLVAAGTTTITATFAEVEDQYKESKGTYNLTVTNSDPNAAGTANNPYTVAQARAAIDANDGITGVYAKGIVSEIVSAYSSQYGNISYNISDDGSTTSNQLESFRGVSYEGALFTSADDIQVGDTVVIYGDLTKYNTTYEFAAGNQLVSLKRETPVEPVTLTAVSDKLWNFSDWEATTFSETTINDNLEIVATSSKTIVIDNSEKSIDNYKFTKCLKFGGSGKSTERNVHFKVAGKSKITVYGMSAKSGETRTLKVDKGSFGTEATTLTNDGTSIGQVVYNYTDSGDTDIYLYSASSGFNIYGIKVEPITGQTDPAVSFAKETISVSVGKTETNTLTKPSDLSVTYSTSDASIATVDENGVVTGVSVGSAIITATWAAVEGIYNAGSKTYTVTVKEGGSEETIIEDFEKQESSTIYNSTKTYEASNSNCEIGWYMYYGTVSTNDKINGDKSAHMRYYSSQNDYPYIYTTTPIENLSSVSFKVRVSDTSIKFNVCASEDGTTWQTIASNVQLETAGAPGVKELSYDTPSGSQYFKIEVSSSTTKPSSGNIKLIIDDVTFTSEETSTEPVDPTVKFAAENVTVNVGKTVKNEISGPSALTYTYASADESIATVAEDGTVTGVAVGTTTITASWAATTKYNAGRASYTVTVENRAEADASISTTTILVGENTATITTTPANLVVTYRSSKESVATVSESGVVTGVADGKATISVVWDEQTIDGVVYVAGSKEFTVNVTTPIQCVFEESYGTRFDFTQNGWGLPAGSGNMQKTEESFTNTGKTITLVGGNGNGYYFNSSGYLLLGKNGAYLTLPAFDYDVLAIEVGGASGASEKITENFYVGETAVSEEITGGKTDNIFFINEAYQRAGNVYTFKLTTNYNAQITWIKVYSRDAFVELSVSDAGYRTYCDESGLDFGTTIGDAPIAYIVEGVDAEGSTNIVMKEVEKVPANTGLVIQAEQGTYYVSKVEEVATAETAYDDVESNLLVGVTEETAVAPSIIVLMNGTDGVGFYKTAKTFTVGANTAYLPLSVLTTVAENADAASGVKTMGIFGVDEDDTPTGINGITADELTGKESVIYNLSGQRVSKAVKGLYIVNGKKVLVK